jgi:hypothetical protein
MKAPQNTFDQTFTRDRTLVEKTFSSLFLSKTIQIQCVYHPLEKGSLSSDSHLMAYQTLSYIFKNVPSHRRKCQIQDYYELNM